MIDLTKYLTDKIGISPEAMARPVPASHWRRARYDGERASKDTITFQFSHDGYAPVKALGSLTEDLRPRLWKVEAVLPALLHGHNGRPIRNRQELALALTILHFLLSMLVPTADQDRLIPGLGEDNLSYLIYFEACVQIQDPDHDLLVSSHFSRLTHQRRATAVYWDESTRMRTREVSVVFYNKAAQMREGYAMPDGTSSTRVEAVYNNADRLARDAAVVLGRPVHDDMPPLATLGIDDAYRLLHQALARVTGFGWGSDIKNLDTIRHPKARLMAGMLGHSIIEPYRLEAALRAYQQIERPGERSYRTVEKELRAFTFNHKLPEAHDILPSDPSGLLRSEVHWPRREESWANLMRDIGAPNVPDPRILKAWSETRFLATKPHPGALVGSVAPSPPPFRRAGF